MFRAEIFPKRLALEEYPPRLGGCGCNKNPMFFWVLLGPLGARQD